MLETVYLCSTLSRYKKKKKIEKKPFYGTLNLCQQKHCTSLVYVTKNCEFCILLITLQMPLKFG